MQLDFERWLRRQGSHLERPASLADLGSLEGSRSADLAGKNVPRVCAPGPVQAFRAEVVDNNVLLYWQPPASGDVDLYELREGPSWEWSGALPRAGCSTFTATFLPRPGNYTFWVAAWNKAGCYGPAVGLTVCIESSPSDPVGATAKETDDA